MTPPRTRVAQRATRINVTRLAAELRAATGINIDGNPADAAAPRHGYVNTVRKPIGQPFFVVEGFTVETIEGFTVDAEGTRVPFRSETRVPFRSEVDDCPYCAALVGRLAAHECCEIVLYDADELANAEHPGIGLRAHRLSAAQIASIQAVLAGHVPGVA